MTQRGHGNGIQLGSAAHRALQAKWDALLEKEDMPPEIPLFVMFDNHDGRADFFAAAEKFLHAHHFKNREEKVIWKLYVDGMPQCRIASAVHLHIHTVAKRITHLRAIMLSERKQNGHDDGSDDGSDHQP